MFRNLKKLGILLIYIYIQVAKNRSYIFENMWW